MDRGAWQAIAHWVTKSQTGLSIHSTAQVPPDQTFPLLLSQHLQVPVLTGPHPQTTPGTHPGCAPRRTVPRRQSNRGESIHSIISHVPAGMTILAAWGHVRRLGSQVWRTSSQFSEKMRLSLHQQCLLPALSHDTPPTTLSSHSLSYTFFKWKWKSFSHVQLHSPWNSPGQNTGVEFPSPGDLPTPGIESRSPTLQVDFLPAEPLGKPKNTGVGSLSLLQGNLPDPGIEPGSPALKADSLVLLKSLLFREVCSIYSSLGWLLLNAFCKIRGSSQGITQVSPSPSILLINFLPG